MDKNVYEFISAQTNDPIVEWKICTISGKPFAIFQSDLEFYDKISPTFDGKKFSIPAPTQCPEERQARRFARRNESKLYRRKCDKTGASIISIYPEKSPYTVYDWKVWYSDERDPMDYGREYDFSKTFFDNFDALNLAVPKKGMHTVDTMENCHFCNYGFHSKNSYLCMAACRAENCLYSSGSVKSTYDIDSTFSVGCQHTYQCAHCFNCFDCAYSDHSSNCKFSRFLSHCNNCEYCLGCVNLQNARHCILNKQYTKEEYESLASTFLKDRQSISDFRIQFEKLTIESERSCLLNVGAENCFSNYMQNTKSNILCYLNLESNEDKYGMGGGYGSNNVYDGYAYTGSSYDLEVQGVTCSKCAFILTAEYGCNECYYCQHINACESCFGCIGIKNKKWV